MEISGYWLTRWLFQRSLALVYLTAFLAVLYQFTPLLGERGLLPVPQFVAQGSFWEAPSLSRLKFVAIALGNAPSGQVGPGGVGL